MLYFAWKASSWIEFRAVEPDAYMVIVAFESNAYMVIFGWWGLLPPSICSTMIWDQMITLWRVSEMKKWWFENAMNRGMTKSCKCWHSGDSRKSRNRPNRRIQPDPPRSFPNKRSGRRSKRLTFVTALKYQKDNRRISLQATLHQPPIPGYCFSHCRPFPASLPLTDPESTKRAVIHAAVLWNHPLATMFFAAIRPYRAGLQRDPVIAAFSCNLCRRRSPGHPPTTSW